MSRITKIISNDNVSEIQECVEQEQTPSEELVMELVQRGFNDEYNVEYIQIESFELGSYRKNVVQGKGSCVVCNASGEEKEYFTYEINHGTSSSGPIYDELEILIDI